MSMISLSIHIHMYMYVYIYIYIYNTCAYVGVYIYKMSVVVIRSPEKRPSSGKDKGGPSKGGFLNDI